MRISETCVYVFFLWGRAVFPISRNGWSLLRFGFQVFTARRVRDPGWSCSICPAQLVELGIVFLRDVYSLFGSSFHPAWGGSELYGCQPLYTSDGGRGILQDPRFERC